MGDPIIITADNPGPDWLAPQFEAIGKVPSGYLVSSITDITDPDYGGGYCFFDGVKDWDHFAGMVGWGASNGHKYVFIEGLGCTLYLLDNGALVVNVGSGPSSTHDNILDVTYGGSGGPPAPIQAGELRLPDVSLVPPKPASGFTLFSKAGVLQKISAAGVVSPVL